MLWTILTWMPGCSVTCTVTLLSMSHCCATLRKPPTDFTHPLQFCSFSNLAVACLPHLEHSTLSHVQSPRNVTEHPSIVCLYYTAVLNLTFFHYRLPLNALIKPLSFILAIWPIQWSSESFTMKSMWSFAQLLMLHRLQSDTYCISIPSTQLVHHIIALMKYVHSETCTNAVTWEWTLRQVVPHHQP